MKKFRTPQEKKELSYKNDSKNDYGESSKSSRKNIPKKKRMVNKTYRGSVKQVIHQNTAYEINDLPDIDSKVKQVKRRKWKKSPDISLGQFLEQKQNPVVHGNEVSYHENYRKRFCKNKK
jgi:hypothetical protein